MAGTVWNVFSPNTKIKSAEFNQNFDWLEGSLTPMNAGSFTDSSFDLGTVSYKWNTAYINNVIAINGIYFNTTSVVAPERIEVASHIMTLYANSLPCISIHASGSSHYIGSKFYASGSSLMLEINGTEINHFSTNNFYASNTVLMLKINGTGTCIPATKKLYLDGGGDTYILESSANIISAYCAGNLSLSLHNDQIIIPATNKFYLDGGNDTYIYEYSANQPYLYCGGTAAAYWSPTVSGVLGSFRLEPLKKLYLDGGDDTYIYESSANYISVNAGGSAAIGFGSSYIDCNRTLKPNGTSIDLGTPSEYWNNIHFHTATAHTLKNPKEMNVTKSLKKVTDFTNKSQFPEEIFVSAKNVGDSEGIAINKLLSYLLKSIQELDERLDKLEGN